MPAMLNGLLTLFVSKLEFAVPSCPADRIAKAAVRRLKEDGIGLGRLRGILKRDLFRKLRVIKCCSCSCTWTAGAASIQCCHFPTSQTGCRDPVCLGIIPLGFAGAGRPAGPG